MMKKTLSMLGVLSAIVLALGTVGSPSVVLANPPAPYKVICHHNPSNTETLTFQTQQAYEGHLGTPHNDGVYDSDGACAESTTPTPTPVVTVTPTPTPADCHGEGSRACPTPTPTTIVTPTPENPGNPGGPGDGKSDGRSDGRSSCPECTKAPSGQVLGASTDFAGTGTAVDMIVNAIGAMGGISTAAGLVMIGKKRTI